MRVEGDSNRHFDDVTTLLTHLYINGPCHYDEIRDCVDGRWIVIPWARSNGLIARVVGGMYDITDDGVDWLLGLR